MEKSLGLNQKTPLYSTRTHPGCIEFKRRTKFLEQKRERDAEHNKNFILLTKERIKWISGAWIAGVRRIADTIEQDLSLPKF